MHSCDSDIWETAMHDPDKAEALAAPRPAAGADNHPDLLVIGAGSTGFSAAIRGAELGARVTLVGHGRAASTIGGR
jgi:NADPH-dependent 2,4-dienoyl-CoA reductase/sulfur reductase-like enzyme